MAAGTGSPQHDSTGECSGGVRFSPSQNSVAPKQVESKVDNTKSDSSQAPSSDLKYYGEAELSNPSLSYRQNGELGDVFVLPHPNLKRDEAWPSLKQKGRELERRMTQMYKDRERGQRTEPASQERTHDHQGADAAPTTPAVAKGKVGKREIGGVEYEYDVLYECQRGMYLFGLPKYSAKSLIQFDPPPWSDRDLKYTPMDIHTFQLPDMTWEWVHPEWLVDMTGDVDENGWQYAVKFHGSVWHGNCETFRSFVRRRRWIRPRRRIMSSDSQRSNSTSSTPPIQNTTSDSPSDKIIPVELPSRNTPLVTSPSTEEAMPSSLPSDVKIDELERELTNRLRSARLDREKTKAFKDFIETGGDAATTLCATRLKSYLQVFDYDQSKRNFIKLIYEHLSQKKNNEQLYQWQQEALRSLDFYSDSQELGQELRSRM